MSVFSLVILFSSLYFVFALITREDRITFHNAVEITSEGGSPVVAVPMSPIECAAKCLTTGCLLFAVTKEQQMCSIIHEGNQLPAGRWNIMGSGKYHLPP